MQEDFYCFESGVAVVSAAGWPATGGRWAVVGGGTQGGEQGWFRSMAIPRWRFPEGTGWFPWELPSLSCPAGHGIF